MGLLTSYSSANAVVEEELCVTYSHRRISGSWGWTAANVEGSHKYMTEHHRYARKSFKYVGMTHAAAEKCAKDMVAKFTRTYMESVWNGDVMNGEWDVKSSGSALMADVACTHVAGEMWEVSVRVNEDDVRHTKFGDAEPPWTDENKRDYSA